MSNKNSLQLAIEKRDKLTKLNKKFKNRSDGSGFVPIFFISAFASLVLRSCEPSNYDEDTVFLTHLGSYLFLAVCACCVFLIYKALVHKYETNIFDADDLAFIKSDATLSYHFEKSLETMNGKQYINESFQKDVERNLNNIIKHIENLELPK